MEILLTRDLGWKENDIKCRSCKIHSIFIKKKKNRILTQLFLQKILYLYEADLPARSGLGTSSSFAVGMLNAFYALKGKYADKKKLADESIHLERVLCNEAGGWQDQIAAAFGGMNRINFNKDGTYDVINELPCPVITVGCNMLGNDGPEWSYVPLREKDTISQDLWDVFVYSPSKKKINMIRFGAGKDREINLS